MLDNFNSKCFHVKKKFGRRGGGTTFLQLCHEKFDTVDSTTFQNEADTLYKYSQLPFEAGYNELPA